MMHSVRRRSVICTHCHAGPPVKLVGLFVAYSSVSQPPGRGPVPGPGINYTGLSSYRKKNLPGRGLTEVESHWPIGCLCPFSYPDLGLQTVVMT
jgi:hypothetical protein